MNVSTLLLISSDPAAIDDVSEVIHEVDGLSIVCMKGLDEAYSYEGWDRVTLVLIHLASRRLINGVSRLLRMIAAARRAVATVILADGLEESATVDLLCLGVADVLPSPFDLGRLAYLADVLTLRARRPVATREPSSTESPLVDESDGVLAQARRVAAQDTTVLICGEIGTGKSRMARAIHEFSPRRKGPFVAIRCATLPPDGFEDELFGYSGMPGTLGSTGGKLADALGGTLVFEDVDALSPLAQSQLLSWMEDDGLEDGGAGRSQRPRLIATTREPLGDLVVSGQFRSDLFYRLNVIGLQLQPLRQRRGEVATLAEELLADLSDRSMVLDADALQAIESHPWPGNVRELRDALASALALGHGPMIGRDSLPDSVLLSPVAPRPAALIPIDEDARLAVITLAQTKREAEYARITEALEKHGHNRLRTASELGISRMTLYKKLYKYGIIEQEGRDGRFPAGRSRRMPISTTPTSEGPPDASFR